MGMSLVQSKSRIKSVSSTQKITKAMELVATSKLKRAKDLNSKINPFHEELISVMSYVYSKIDASECEYVKENTKGKRLVVIISSTLGLCGGYNNALFKY